MAYDTFKTGMIGKKVQIKLLPVGSDSSDPEVISVGILSAYTLLANRVSWAFQHRPDVGSADFDTYKVDIEVFKDA